MCTVFQADSCCLSLADEKHIMSQLILPHTVNLANEKLALMFFLNFFFLITTFVQPFCCVFKYKLCAAGIQEGTECTKCKNDWALRVAIALLYVLCTLLTIAVAVLGYKGG